MTWHESIKNIKWKQKFRYFLEIASDASDVLIHLREKPKTTDYASIALKIANSWTHHSDKFKTRPFKGWNMVDLWEYKDFLYDISKRTFEHEVLQDIEDHKAILMNIHGVEFGWDDFGADSRVTGPYVRKDVPREVWMEALGKMVWAEVGSNSCEISKKKGVVEDDFGGGGVTVFKVDRQDNVHESKVAHSILDRSKLFLDKGYNRSIMLYGVPGTGKSSAMRFVAKEFGKYSLRISVGDLDHLSSEDMLLAIELLRPSTLMIDDFDRSINPTKFLTELEEFNNHVQLLMVSVNNIDRLDDAVVRPGRFDDVIEVDMLDSEIVDRLIGEDIPDDVRKRLRKLPIAFVVEFHKRREVLGLEKALEEVVDLEKRIRNLHTKISDGEVASTSRKKRKKRNRARSAKKASAVEIDIIVGKDPNES